MSDHHAISARRPGGMAEEAPGLQMPQATGPGLAAADRAGPFASTTRFAALVLVLMIGLVVGGVAAVSVGAVHVSPGVVWAVVGSHAGLPGVHVQDPVADRIVWSVRVPRVLLAMVVGAGLAVAGVVIQAVVRNALGDPYLIGVVPGAGLGAAAVIVSGGSALGGIPVSGAAFLGALAAFVLTFALARHSGGWTPSRLVLAGVAVGYLAGAFTYLLQVIATPNESQRVLFWSLGSVSGASWADLGLPTLVIALGTGWLLVNGARLNALVSGTEVAATLGIAVGRLQFALMALASLVIGCVVAVAGGVVFVGMIVPHIARLLVGADHRRVLVTSLLLGAIFLPLVDLLARTLRSPAELPLGVVTAAVGAPFFLWLLRTVQSGAAR